MRHEELKNVVKRVPAEWEAQEAVLMAFPHPDTDWGNALDAAMQQFARIIAELARHGDRVVVVARDAEGTSKYLDAWFCEELGDSRGRELVTVVEMDINDTWTRDYGPIGVVVEGDAVPNLLDFGFNAWGLKFVADKDNQVNSRLCQSGVLAGEQYVDCRDFIFEGGSMESDGKGTLLTTSQCLLSPNRNPTYARQEIERVMRERLGFERVLWLDHGHISGDDTDSHIDTLCRFGPGDVILYTSAGDHADEQHDDLMLMYNQLCGFRTAEGKPYHLVELPLPDPIFDNEGNRLGATYSNFLVTPKNVYVPSYGQPQKDRLAAMTIQAVYHDRTIVPVDCRMLITQGGSLHCSTMQLYPGSLNNHSANE